MHFTDPFPALTIGQSEPALQPTLRRIEAEFGALPEAVARQAHSPETLQAFLGASARFEQCTLSPVERETVIMTVAVRNGCGLCVNLHTKKLSDLGASPRLVDSLRGAGPTGDVRLDALVRMVHLVMDHCGAVPDPSLTAFLDAGFTPRQALEVVLGVGTYTLSTYANRLVGAH